MFVTAPATLCGAALANPERRRCSAAYGAIGGRRRFTAIRGDDQVCGCVTVAGRPVGEDDAPDARDGSGDREDGTALGDHGRDPGSAAARQRFDDERCSPGPGLGAADRPVDRWTRGDRRRGCPQRCSRPVDEAANCPTREAERARDLLVAGPVQRRADEHLSLERGQRRHPRECRASLQALLHKVLDLVPTGNIRDLMRHGGDGTHAVEGRVVRDPVQPRPDLPHLRT
jgi:hypothetical protein